MARVTLAGSLAQRPGAGGHAWVFLNWLLGLRGLGHQVGFVDRLEAGDGATWSREVLGPFDLEGDWVPIDGEPGARRGALDLLRRTDLLIDVNGYLGDAELLDAPAVTAFLDIDPAIQQMWQALDLASIFGRHDLYLTVGSNLGAEDCLVPDLGIEWVPVRPPVFIEAWPALTGGNGFTSLATWRGPYAPIEFEGRTFGQRVHEFRRFVELPERVDAEFRLALDVEPGDQRDIDALRGSGWQLLDPTAVAVTPAAYQDFIGGSSAELAIPKEIYAATRSGWFSDRSACYLASGKPVLSVDTGFAGSLPTGEGLLVFDDLDGAVAACEEVRRNPAAHQRAAREIAAEYFDAARVLEGVLDVAGI